MNFSKILNIINNYNNTFKNLKLTKKYSLYFAGGIKKNDWHEKICSGISKYKWQIPYKKLTINENLIYEGPYIEESKILTKRFRCIERSDIIIAYINNSSNIHELNIELGYAYALKKKVLVFISDIKEGFSNEILQYILEASDLCIEVNNENELLEKIYEYLLLYSNDIKNPNTYLERTTDKQSDYIINLIKDNYNLSLNPNEINTIKSLTKAQVGKLISIL